MNSAEKRIRELFPDATIKENEPLAPYTSFKIGGPAEIFIEPSSVSELCELMKALKELGIRPFVFGRGTNLLISDKGLPGVCIHMGEGLNSLRLSGETGIYAGAGVNMAVLASFARDNSLKGLEFAHGIPGSVGGGIFMNAGAYGGEMKDVCIGVDAVSEDGEAVHLDDCGFSYRHSCFEGNGLIITGAEFALSKGDKDEISDTMKTLSQKRASSQPLGLPSAGSAFKRPQSGYAAAMIDAAGLKGFCVGGARVSEKHAGFIVTDGNASFRDVIDLIEKVREAVYKDCGTLLEPEVRIIGRI